MGRMIDLVKQKALPANMMRSAARGALSVAPGEMVEILVFLSNHPLFGGEARTTLASWDEKTTKTIVGDPRCSPDVLSYYMSFDNLRLPLLNTLMANPSVTDEMIVRLAMQASTRVLANMLWHPRVLCSVKVLHAISLNVNLPEDDAVVVRSALTNLGEDTEYLTRKAELDGELDDSAVPEDILDAEYDRYTREHAEEIAAEENGGGGFELYVDAAPKPPEDAPPQEAIGPVIGGAGAVPSLIQSAVGDEENAKELRRKLTAFQKIAGLGVGQRVQLAMKGNKDERFILVRDGSKVVSQAVLESPKLTEQEIETFATLKNVQESVIRGISMKRKFMRNYIVQRNLVNNPRAPLDVTLPLLKGLMINDLRTMANNKNVNDTLRKMSHKLYKQRTEKKAES